MTHFKDATEFEFSDRNFQISAWAFISQVKNFYGTEFEIKFPTK